MPDAITVAPIYDDSLQPRKKGEPWGDGDMELANKVAGDYCDEIKGSQTTDSPMVPDMKELKKRITYEINEKYKLGRRRPYIENINMVGWLLEKAARDLMDADTKAVLQLDVKKQKNLGTSRSKRKRSPADMITAGEAPVAVSTSLPVQPGVMLLGEEVRTTNNVQFDEDTIMVSSSSRLSDRVDSTSYARSSSDERPPHAMRQQIHPTIQPPQGTSREDQHVTPETTIAPPYTPRLAHSGLAGSHTHTSVAANSIHGQSISQISSVGAKQPWHVDTSTVDGASTSPDRGAILTNLPVNDDEEGNTTVRNRPEPDDLTRIIKDHHRHLLQLSQDYISALLPTETSHPNI